MDLTTDLAVEFAVRHPEEAARILETMPTQAAAEALSPMPSAAAAAVLSLLLPPRKAAAVLAALPAGAVAGTVSALRDSSLARLLGLLREQDRQPLLQSLPQVRREYVQRLSRYATGTAGALMEAAAFAVPVQMTTAEALQRIGAAEGHANHQVYVVDADAVPVGVLTLRELLMARPDADVKSVMLTPVPKVHAGSYVDSDTAERFGIAPEIAVVDGKGRLLGVLDSEALRHGVKEDLRGTGKGSVLQETVLSAAELYWTMLAGIVGGIVADD